MTKDIIKVTAKVNGKVYKSEVDRVIQTEEDEQITSCIRQIRKMLDKDNLSDVQPDYIIERYRR